VNFGEKMKVPAPRTVSNLDGLRWWSQAIGIAVNNPATFVVTLLKFILLLFVLYVYSSVWMTLALSSDVLLFLIVTGCFVTIVWPVGMVILIIKSSRDTFLRILLVFILLISPSMLIPEIYVGIVGAFLEKDRRIKLSILHPADFVLDRTAKLAVLWLLWGCVLGVVGLSIAAVIQFWTSMPPLFEILDAGNFFRTFPMVIRVFLLIMAIVATVFVCILPFLVVMAFWFSSFLIAWEGMATVDAIQYSFDVCRKNYGAMLLNILVMLAVAVAIFFLMLFMPIFSRILFLVFGAILALNVYASYRSVFENVQGNADLLQR